MHCLLALQSKLLYLSKKHTFRAKSKCKELIISKWHFFTVKLSDYSVSNIFVLEIKWVFFEPTPLWKIAFCIDFYVT